MPANRSRSEPLLSPQALPGASGEAIPFLEELSIRESSRARRVHFRATVHDGLEMVIPRGFDRRRIPRIVAEHRVWLERAHARVLAARKDLPEALIDPMPRDIVLQAIGRSWSVIYESRAVRSVRVTPFPERLLVQGGIADADLIASALRSWLRLVARGHLPDLLRQVSGDLGLGFSKCVIRFQKTRWGSCSSRGEISLNARLMFVPPEVVRYLMVHELCHTRFMNHSRQYWALVSSLQPDHERLDRELGRAWRHVPRWAQG